MVANVSGTAETGGIRNLNNGSSEQALQLARDLTAQFYNETLPSLRSSDGIHAAVQGLREKIGDAFKNVAGGPPREIEESVLVLAEHFASAPGSDWPTSDPDGLPFTPESALQQASEIGAELDVKLQRWDNAPDIRQNVQNYRELIARLYKNVPGGMPPQVQQGLQAAETWYVDALRPDAGWLSPKRTRPEKWF